MQKLAIGLGISVFATTAFFSWYAWSQANALSIASLVILSLTLLVLIWYAYDTNSIARVTRARWLRDGVLSTTYSMDLVGTKGDAGRTLFRLHNPSPLLVRAKANFNFRLYGDPVEGDPPYSGKGTWLLFPQQVSQGWFEIDLLLQKKGKNVVQMIAERTPANHNNQFTMFLELDFSDELGEKRKLPGRSHYFDFDRWAWIPQLMEIQKS